LNRSALSMMLMLHALCAPQWVAIGGEWMCQAGRQPVGSVHDAWRGCCLLCLYRVWLPTDLRAVLASDVHKYRLGAQ
jgi:hypothetical protein